MSEQNFQLREIDRDIVHVDRVTVLASCIGKNRRASVDHDWDAMLFGSAIDLAEPLAALQVFVRIDQLVRRMYLEQPHASRNQALHLRFDIVGELWMKST